MARNSSWLSRHRILAVSLVFEHCCLAHVHANFKSSEARLSEILSNSNYSIYDLEQIPLAVSNKYLCVINSSKPRLIVRVLNHGNFIGPDSTLYRVPALRRFWDLKKPVIRKIHVSGTVEGLLLTRKIPQMYISQKTVVVGTKLVILV